MLFSLVESEPGSRWPVDRLPLITLNFELYVTAVPQREGFGLQYTNCQFCCQIFVGEIEYSLSNGYTVTVDQALLNSNSYGRRTVYKRELCVRSLESWLKPSVEPLHNTNGSLKLNFRVCSAEVLLRASIVLSNLYPFARQQLPIINSNIDYDRG